LWRTHRPATTAAELPCWAQSERAKHLFPECQELFKFIGLPPYGDRPVLIASSLADAGFSPQVLGFADGYLVFRWQAGRRFDALQDEAPVERIASYLVERTRSFAASSASSEELSLMVRTNVAEALGRELPSSFELEIERPTFVDGRLSPCEWLATPDGQILKTDSSDHGDDHFFPGPCDVAWDIAGAISEWELDATATELLLRRYRAGSGDDAGPRLPAYVVAYSAFRLGWAELALVSAPEPERPALERLRERYRRQLTRATLARNFR
jgi:hypothetical protein